MTRLPLRRLALHTVLSIATTPFPGWSTIGVRAIHARQTGIGFAAFTTAVFATLGGLALPFVLPFSLLASAMTVALLWVGFGLLAFAVELRYQLAPPRDVGTSALGQRLLLWPAVVAVTWLPVAVVIATVTSRWGAELFQKPSMPREVLFASLIGLVPIGIVIGVGRALLRRPFATTAPLAFAVALPAVSLAVLLGAAAFQLLREEALHLPEFIALPVAVFPDIANGLSYLSMALAILLAAYLADATTVGGFLARCLAAVGFTFLALVNQDVICGSLPLCVRHELALRNVASGNDTKAAQSWRWMTRYAPVSDGGSSFVEYGVAAALRSGQPEVAADLLAGVAALAPHHPVDGLMRTSRAISATSLSTDAIAVTPLPVLPEDYLSDNWCVALTAAWAASPELTESRLKRRLQSLSRSSDTLNLPGLNGFHDLRILARSLELEAWALPFDRLEDVLRGGRPALLLDPVTGVWTLAIRLMPGSNAVELIDYVPWIRNERPLDEDDAVRLVAAEDHGAEQRLRISAEVRSIRSHDGLRERQALDGGWLFVLTPAGVAPVADAALDDADAWANLSRARAAIDAEAPLLAQQFIAGMPAGRERTGIEKLGSQIWALNHRYYGPLHRELVPPGQAPLPPQPASIESLSPWGLEVMCVWSFTLDLPCEDRASLLRRLYELEPDNRNYAEAWLDYLIETEALDEAATVALHLAREDSFADGALLLALTQLAPVAADQPAARRVVQELLARLQDLVLSDATDFPITTRHSAPVIAGRAALADGEAAVDGWRHAVEIDSGRASYRLALARALTAAGHEPEAAIEREQADRLTGTRVCPARLPNCH